MVSDVTTPRKPKAGLTWATRNRNIAEKVAIDWNVYRGAMCAAPAFSFVAKFGDYFFFTVSGQFIRTLMGVEACSGMRFTRNRLPSGMGS